LQKIALAALITAALVAPAAQACDLATAPSTRWTTMRENGIA
jgi:hypothetical protein